MNINSEFGQADAAEIVRLVREEDVGLLTIQEHSQALEDRLAPKGCPCCFPTGSATQRTTAPAALSTQCTGWTWLA
jgi:hypothetical protein